MEGKSIGSIDSEMSEGCRYSACRYVGLVDDGR